MNSFTVIALISGMLFLIGSVHALRMRRFIRKGVRVRAKVVNVLDVRAGDTGSSMERYVVEIPLRGGRRRRGAVADAVGGSVAGGLVADDGTIAVIYDSKNPNIVRIDSPWVLYICPLFFCAPGFLLLSLVAYVWLMA